METNIEVEIKYDMKEVKKALSYFILRISKMYMYFAITFSMVFFAIVFSTFNSLNNSHYAGLPVLFFVCGVLFFYIYYIRPMNGYISFYQKRKRSIYHFSEDKILIVGEDVQSTCSWRLFKKAYETPNSFLLLDENKFIYIFPKSCFSHLSDIERLRGLMTKTMQNFKSL